MMNGYVSVALVIVTEPVASKSSGMTSCGIAWHRSHCTVPVCIRPLLDWMSTVPPVPPDTVGQRVAFHASPFVPDHASVNTAAIGQPPGVFRIRARSRP